MRTQSFCHRALVAVVCILAGLIPAHAQINTSSLTGLVVDPSGADIAHATVTVTNKETGLTRTDETDGAGYYNFPSLPIGLYTVSVKGAGFAGMSEEVQLDGARKGRRDFTLRVGSSQETVSVSADGSTLSPDDASISTVITSDVIQQTPLYQRNWDDLLRTVPGVQINRFTQQSGATSAGRTGSFNVHGVHSLQNNFILDGIDNNTISENVQELSTQAAHPSVDTIQQFTIVTNPYSSEYGRAPGAALSVNTKGGSNDFHFLAFEYLRNDFFDATDYFTKRQKVRKAQNNQHQFGGSVSGPIIHDHLFAFFNYEGTRIKQGVSRTSTVPLPNERIGDFSPATAALLGLKPYPTIYDPQTNQPFANNKIPFARLDKAVQGIIALFPQPNKPGQLNNYFRNAGLSDNNDSYDGRVDWIASKADTVFVRYSYINRSRFIPGNYGGIADGTTTSAFGRQKIYSHSAAIGWTHIFTPNVLNEFHLGFIRNRSLAQQDPFGLNAADEFVPGIPNNPAVAGGVPLTQFSNFTFIGSPDFLPKSQTPQQVQTVDTVSLALGKHTLKLGGTVYAPMRNIFQDEPGARGDLNFTGIFSCQRGGANNQCVAGGLSYADGLLGLAQSTQLTNVHFVDQRLWMVSGFAQDDWKLLPNLTVNLGLRYDFASPALEGKNQQANFDPNANGGAGGLVLAKSGSLKDRALINPNYKNFGPRFGISYSPDAKTVIRAGYGYYYSMFERFGSENQLALNPPFLINKTPAVASNSTTPALIAQNGFPSNFLDPSTIDLTHLQSFHLRTMNPHAPAPNVQQWSFGVQRELPAKLTAEINYVGTKSTHLDVIRDLNQPSIAAPGAPSKVPFANFGYIEYTNSIGFGNYNGLEATLTRRFSNGFSFRTAYTYSHSLDNTPQELESNSGAPPDGRNYGAWYSNSDFDIPNRFSANYLYELPFGKGKTFASHGVLSAILGGFRTSGVHTFYSGHPFTINGGGTLATALDPYGQATATLNVIGKPTLVHSPDCWYFASKNGACATLAPNATNAFSLPAPGVIGNSGRNTLRGPHTNVFDAALLREFPIREKANVEFRWEVFNVGNTPLFGQPNNNFSSGAAGQITTLSGDPRVMQLALRLSY
ncbi:TonB-dependent receptor [Edaphobacter bradus]|uniref:TonB-dependent receptor n=1 Tax=Edaphobacter bradus TaxID=2259016 RepID=UPI0021DFEE95|nr:TonB-dependent receptor [Edaphobacter bradus]